MAEILVYNTDHWYDKLSPQEKAAEDAKDKYKFRGRYKRGDAVEIQEDGFFLGKKGRGYDKTKFVVIKVPGTKEENKHLLESKTYKVISKSVLQTIIDNSSNDVAIDRKLFKEYTQRNIKRIANPLVDKAEVQNLTVEDKEEWQL